jgi:hypothetical protein
VNKVKILPSVYFPFHFPTALFLSSAASWLDEISKRKKDIFTEMKADEMFIPMAEFFLPPPLACSQFHHTKHARKS